MDEVDGLTVNGIDYNIYGDQAYVMAHHFIVQEPNAAPESAVARLNTTMVTVRICTSEWYYQIVKNTCPSLRYCIYQKAFWMRPANQYLCALLLTNMKTCLNCNIISAYFDCEPSMLTEYLHSAQW